MKIKLSSVIVNDQEKALKFYTDVLRFVKKTEFPAGDFKWLTVVSPEGPDDNELALEPNAIPAAQAFQSALFQAGIPLRAFEVNDIQKEYERLVGLGVAFKGKPANAGPVTAAVFDDTCGNLIMIYQV